MFVNRLFIDHNNLCKWLRHRYRVYPYFITIYYALILIICLKHYMQAYSVSISETTIIFSNILIKFIIIYILDSAILKSYFNKWLIWLRFPWSSYFRAFGLWRIMMYFDINYPKSITSVEQFYILIGSLLLFFIWSSVFFGFLERVLVLRVECFAFDSPFGNTDTIIKNSVNLQKKVASGKYH